MTCSLLFPLEMMNEAMYTDPFHPHLILHRVDGDSFRMGGTDEETYSYEKPVYKVIVTSFISESCQ